MRELLRILRNSRSGTVLWVYIYTNRAKWHRAALHEAQWMQQQPISKVGGRMTLNAKAGARWLQGEIDDCHAIPDLSPKPYTGLWLWRIYQKLIAIFPRSWGYA
eukprot:286254-Pleurochrysis_carterae.AAC.1